VSGIKEGRKDENMEERGRKWKEKGEIPQISWEKVYQGKCQIGAKSSGEKRRKGAVKGGKNGVRGGR